MICGVCNKEFEPHHFNQKYCCEECKTEARRQSKEKYKKTEKGKEAERRWRSSEKCKEAEKRYRQTEEAKKKAVIRAKRYLETHPEAREKKRIRYKEYGHTAEGRARNNIATAKYYRSEKGRLTRICGHYNSRSYGKIDKEYVAELLKGDTCYYCGEKITGKKTIDHKTPSTRGGTNDNENIVLCCVRCNTQKQNKTEEEYREWLKLK